MITIKTLSTISLAKKAGKVVNGEDAVKNAVRDSSAKLVILAEDAGKNTVKSIENSCSYYGAKLLHFGTKDELGRLTGKSFNAVIAICDAGFANSIEKAILTKTNGGEVL